MTEPAGCFDGCGWRGAEIRKHLVEEHKVASAPGLAEPQTRLKWTIDLTGPGAAKTWRLLVGVRAGSGTGWHLLQAKTDAEFLQFEVWRLDAQLRGACAAGADLPGFGQYAWVPPHRGGRPARIVVPLAALAGLATLALKVVFLEGSGPAP